MESFTQDPRESNFVQNPYPFYDKTRYSPLFFWTDYNIICASSYEVVNTILRDRRFGREAPKGFAPTHPEHVKPFYAVEQHSILEREPPTHTRLRSLLTRAFTSRRIAELEPQIEALTHQLIDGFEGDTVDLLPEFCEKIPIIIISRMLGVPDEMADQLLAWSHDMVAMYQVRRDRAVEDAAVKATLEFSAFIRNFIDARTSDPRDDLISHLITARDEGAKLSTEELITTCILLLNAGHEATVHSFANGIKCILENPDVINYAFLSPKTTLALIDETIRYDPPLHKFTRYAMEDISVFGHDFKTGDIVGLLLGAANHDPEEFDNPGAFDVVRGGVGNLSFGAGLHFCIGAPLAKLEMAVALPILFERFPNIKLAEPPVYADRYHFHGLEALKCTLTHE